MCNVWLVNHSTNRPKVPLQSWSKQSYVIYVDHFSVTWTISKYIYIIYCHLHGPSQNINHILSFSWTISCNVNYRIYVKILNMNFEDVPIQDHTFNTVVCSWQNSSLLVSQNNSFHFFFSKQKFGKNMDKNLSPFLIELYANIILYEVISLIIMFCSVLCRTQS